MWDSSDKRRKHILGSVAVLVNLAWLLSLSGTPGVGVDIFLKPSGDAALTSARMERML